MRLLLAEDEEMLARTICAILQKNNYEVTTVFDGLTAYERLQSGQFDAAILDVMMPGMDGIRLTQELRLCGNQTPILLLTAKAELEDKVTGLDSGANDYLTKPFEVPELLARIRAMTRTQSSASSAILQLGNIQLNRLNFELSSPTGSHHLTNKEFHLMEMLLQNANRLLPAERIMERVWGYDSDAEINVVWVYISYLRRKLNELNANVQIRLTRGAGYTLEEIP